MENWMLILVLGYVFSLGFFLITRIPHRKHREYPISKRALIIPDAAWQPIWEGDEPQVLCYNDSINCKEREKHEICDP